jgi:phytoene dehydrogenase-like protein
VVSVATDGAAAEVECADGQRVHADHVLANVAPTELSRLMGEPAPATAPEGSQLKINMLLARLLRLRDSAIAPRDAFAGTFHVNEGYEQQRVAFAQARDGDIPATPPCGRLNHVREDGRNRHEEGIRTAGRHDGCGTITVFVTCHRPRRNQMYDLGRKLICRLRVVK